MQQTSSCEADIKRTDQQIVETKSTLSLAHELQRVQDQLALANQELQKQGMHATQMDHSANVTLPILEEQNTGETCLCVSVCR